MSLAVIENCVGLWDDIHFLDRGLDGGTFSETPI